MKIGIVGETYDQISLPFDAQRSINFFPVFDKTGKEIAAMYGTPGKILFGSLGSGPHRAEFNSATGRSFCVSGSQFYEVNVDGTGTLRGTLDFSNGIVYIEENSIQIGLCDGVSIYIMNYATNTFTKVIGGLEYCAHGDMGSSSGWTLPANWTITGGFAKALNATGDLTRTASYTIVAGKTYTISYDITGVSYVQNGDFGSSTGWTIGGGWAIASGVATGTATSNNLDQTTPETLVNGQDYLVTITVTRTAGSFVMSLGAGTAGAAISTSGTFQQTITAGATQILRIDGTGFTGTLDNLSVVITPSGDVTPNVGGKTGVKRTSSGSFVETIVAASTQEITFTGASFTGKITNVSVKDPAFGLPSSISSLTYLDSFFLAGQNSTGRFYKSAANNGLSWNALDFANAESSPDDLRRPVAAVGQLFLLGKFTGEIWTNTGASAFPFQKVAGGKMTMGIYAPASAIEIDNTLFWIGRDKNGYGIVYRANGFIPKAISTDPITNRIKAATDGENIRGYVYQESQHVFYILTGGGLETSLCYDIATGLWHERAYMNSQGKFEQDLGACYMNAFGKHIVGDRTNGNLYIMDSNTYTDNGAPLVAERVYTHLNDEAKRIRYNNLVIGVESGVGLQSGQGSDPVIELQLSSDGARTYSDTFTEKVGKVGEYKNKCAFRRLGVAEQMTFKIRISDPVKRVIVGSYLT